MNWRPKEEWNAREIFKEVRYPASVAGNLPYFYQLIEAGADAMLEALKREGTYVKAGDMVEEGITYMRSGWEIFIPDEEIR